MGSSRKRANPSASPEASVSGGESGSDDESQGTSVLGVVWTILILRDCLCELCGGWSSEDSPLTTANARDRWGGKRPWLKYYKDSKKLEKSPRSCYCLLCFNVYKGLSCDLSCLTRVCP